MSKNKKTALAFASGTFASALSVVMCISLGTAAIPFDAVLGVLGNKILGLSGGDVDSRYYELIIWEVRVPRVLLAAFIGGGLSVAGAVMQAMFRNPLAEPGILGWSGGGAFFAVATIYAGIHQQWFLVLPITAFAGTLITAWLVYGISRYRGFVENATLLLCGVAIGTLFVSLTTFVLSISDAWSMKEMLFWIMGGLDSRTWTHLAMASVPITIASVILLFYAKNLNAQLLGYEAAKTIGVDVERTTRHLIILSSLIIGASVAVSGIIGFVGLIVPHSARLVVGVDYRKLLPASLIAGAIFLPIADLVARTIMSPQELRLGVITSFMGVPFFLFLLRRNFHGKTGA